MQHSGGTAGVPREHSGSIYPPMTRKQIAARYGVSEKQLRSWIRDFTPQLMANKKTLTPAQVATLVAELGPWP